MKRPIFATFISDKPMNAKNLKIFIGPTDIARIGATLADAFRKRGIKVTVVSGELNPTQDGMKYDIVVSTRGKNIIQKVFMYLHLFLTVMFQHNAFIFLFGVSLLPYNLDLPILKLLGKTTVMWFVGSDISNYECLEAAAKKAGVKYYISKDQGMGTGDLKSKLRMIHKIEKYVDYIISYPSISQLLTRKYIRMDIPLDINNITYNKTPNKIALIVHAPTDDKIKGTTQVLAAMKRLKSEGYDFELQLFKGMSNVQVLKALSEADISVDQLFAHFPGMFAVESMAAGCVVLGGNIPEFSGFPKESPIIHTDPDNIYQNLKILLGNPRLRQELGQKGRKYVEKYHNSLKIADDFIRLLTTGETEEIYTAKQSVKEIINQAKKVNDDF